MAASNSQGIDAVRERVEKRRQQGGSATTGDGFTFLQKVRGYADALVFAFLLAMFIRSYAFELYQIPTGSMTPTLIGDEAGFVAFDDYDEDGIQDVIYSMPSPEDMKLQIFLMNSDGTYKDQLFLMNVDPMLTLSLRRSSPHRKDMIIVNKFAYWFSNPKRGDVAVFKVPDSKEFAVDKPVYIKRVCGLENEDVLLRPVNYVELGPRDRGRSGSKYGGVELHIKDQPMMVDGKEIAAAPFDKLMHFPKEFRYHWDPTPGIDAQSIHVPDDSVLMLGDNAASSQDGRYFGPFNVNHLRGRAILRYWPWRAFGRLK